MEDFIVVCDLEATCWEDGSTQTIDRMESIEIGCVLCDMTGKYIDEFSTFVRPVQNPVLTDFCKKLTTITQADVDTAPIFCDAMRELDQWLDERSDRWASWGRFDRKLLLNEQQRYDQVCFFTSMAHVNVKDVWRGAMKKSRNTDLHAALAFHGMEFQGVPHRALTDAKNTARLLPYIPIEKMRRHL